MPLRLDGRVVIVTGAGKGLGRAYAEYLAACGARVLINNRRRDSDAPGQASAEQVAAAIVADGGEAAVNLDDVSDPRSGERMVTQALDTWGRLDGLVNNAGVEQHRAFHQLSIDEFRAVLDVNFLGSLYVTHAAWPRMRAARHGRIVMSTSSAGLHGLHGLSSYSAAKAAIVGLTRSLAQEGQSRNIFVNAVAPYAATQMTDPHATPEFQATMDAALVAPLVALLVSETCHVNGQVIVAGKGAFRRAAVIEGRGLAYRERADLTPERLADDLDRIFDMTDAREHADAFASFQDFFASTPGTD